MLGTLNIAAREKLDNMILVINCNLQSLDGPVRGNGKIIQELERSFRGAGWNVIKVVWGSDWDGLLARDPDGRLQQRMEQTLDGDYQYLSISNGAELRRFWTEGDPQLATLLNSLTDDELLAMRRGGQDRKKIYAAYHKAVQSEGRPTVSPHQDGEGRRPGQRRSGAQYQPHQKAAEQRGAPRLRPTAADPPADGGDRPRRLLPPRRRHPGRSALPAAATTGAGRLPAQA